MAISLKSENSEETTCIIMKLGNLPVVEKVIPSAFSFGKLFINILWITQAFNTTFFFSLKIIIFFNKWRQHFILINVAFFPMVSLMLHDYRHIQAVWYGWKGLLPGYMLSFIAKAFIHITTVIIFSIGSNMLCSKYSNVTVCHIKIFLRDVLVGKPLQLQLKSLVAVDS